MSGVDAKVESISVTGGVRSIITDRLVLCNVACSHLKQLFHAAACAEDTSDHDILLVLTLFYLYCINLIIQ